MFNDNAQPLPDTPEAERSMPPNHLKGHIQRGLKNYARNKAPGPDGSRCEHWDTIYDDGTALDSLNTILYRITQGTLPQNNLDAILTSQLATKVKPNGKSDPWQLAHNHDEWQRKR